MERWYPKPWALPLIVAAIVLPTVVAFALAGPSVGVAVGGLSIGAIVLIAARSRTRGPITGPEPAAGDPLLVLTAVPIEEPGTANQVAALAEALPGDGIARILVLAPARASTLRRWLSDVGPARFDAQRSLALSLGTLAAAGCAAEGRVVDEDPVQAIEDAVAVEGAALVTFVVPAGALAAEFAEVRSRLDRPVHRVEVREPFPPPRRAGG